MGIITRMRDSPRRPRWGSGDPCGSAESQYMGSRMLNCLIEGESNIFVVRVWPEDVVSELKESIQSKRALDSLEGVGPHTLELWKLKDSNSIAAEPDDTLVERIGLLGHDLSKFADKLGPSRTVFSIFRTQPDRDHIHIIVKVPRTIMLSASSSNESNASSIPSVSDDWSPRHATVCRLYDILCQERLVHVRGTPGSGKTSLMNLLLAFILEREPSAFVKIQHSWVPEESDELLKKRLRIIDPAFPRSRRDGTAYLLFDEAQDSYEDDFLWNDFFKGVGDHGYNNYRVILFCSYGSPSSRPVLYHIGTPLELTNAARISLWPRNGMQESIGILLNRSEFDEVVLRFEHQMNLHPDILDLIFAWTVGHAGAVIEMLNTISYQRVAATRHGEVFTVKKFYDENPTHKLARGLSGGAFGRGLPSSDDLSSQPSVAALLRNLLGKGTIKTNEYENEAIRICHHSGWIHSDQDTGATYYAFPSPLHAVCVSWRLSPTSEMPGFTCLFDLIVAVISKFKPSQLESPIRRVGHGSTDRVPEVQYQDEFYRSLFSITDGNVRVSPEFASAKRALVAGRIDFFIPVKEWGVEITRDGGRLSEHSSRFVDPGAYGAWLKSEDMADYILLDCCTSIPREVHPDIPKLFHVVFQDGYRKVVVYNNMLRQVKGPIALLENHS